MMSFNLYDEENTLIMIPGPIEFHPRIIRSMARKVYGHRTKYFRDILYDIYEKLRMLFRIKNGVVLTLSGSGTLAMDSAVRSVATKEDIILNFTCGKFSERFYEIARTVPHKRIITRDVGAMLNWGQVFTTDRISEILDRCQDTDVEPTIITLCHNETSTGVIIDLESISRVIRDRFPDSLIIVDGITSVGAVPIDVEKLGVDVFVTGSQKCLETPPGLGIVALSDRAIKRIDRFIRDGKVNFDEITGYYNHLALYLNHWRKKKDLPFTGAVSLYYALKTALDGIFEEGLEKRYKRISTLSYILRESIRAMGLKLLIEERDNVDVDKYASPTITAITYPKLNNSGEIDLDSRFRSLVRKMGVLIAGGQSELKGKIFRVATMGRVGPREIITVLGTVEYALRKLGFTPQKSGVEHALELMESKNIEEII